MTNPNYLEANRALWNAWTPHHLQSDFYALEAFKAGKSSLMPIELPLLGDVSNLDLLHLQCHFGQDSLSLQRMGANVTGVDLAPTAIEAARNLNKELGLNAQFVCSDVLQLQENLQGQFDVVYTSYGVLGWLPDLDRWAHMVHHFLKPGGKLVLVEFHPTFWMLDDNQENLQYSYFNRGADVEDLNGSYAAPDSGVEATAHYWNHGLSETIMPLKRQGLELLDFQEYDAAPYNIFANGVEVANGYQIKGLEGTLPLVFSLVMRKPLA